MGLRINTNITSLSAQRSLHNSTSDIQKHQGRLSSGLRIRNAADDAAGLGISTKMGSETRGLAVAARNAQDAVGLLETAQSAMSEVNNVLARIQELTVQAGTGTTGAAEDAILDVELQELILELEHVVENTRFNDQDVLNAARTVNIHVGVEPADFTSFDLTDMSAVHTGFAGLDLTTAAGIVNVKNQAELWHGNVSGERGRLGGIESRLRTTQRALHGAREQMATSTSRIRDADIAEETASLVRASILQSAGVGMLMRANDLPNLAMRLL